MIEEDTYEWGMTFVVGRPEDAIRAHVAALEAEVAHLRTVVANREHDRNVLTTEVAELRRERDIYHEAWVAVQGHYKLCIDDVVQLTQQLEGARREGENAARDMVFEELDTTIAESPAMLGQNAEDTIAITHWLKRNIERRFADHAAQQSKREQEAGE